MQVEGYEWDDAKNQRNIVLRDLSFAVAPALFDGDVIDAVDRRHACGQERRIAIGVTGEVVLVCVYTNRGAVRHIISLRQANRKERNGYRQAYPG